jgi:predicted esterase
VADRLDVRPETTVLLGLNQGAQVALECLARGPETFAGAVAIVPASPEGSQLDEVKPSPDLAHRGVVVVLGTLENGGRRQLAYDDSRWFQKAGALSLRASYSDLAYGLPGDFKQRLPEWVGKVLERRGK